MGRDDSAAVATLSRPTFLPVKVVQAPVAEKIEILINQTICLRIDVRTDPATVRLWIRALKDDA